MSSMLLQSLVCCTSSSGVRVWLNSASDSRLSTNAPLHSLDAMMLENITHNCGGFHLLLRFCFLSLRLVSLRLRPLFDTLSVLPFEIVCSLLSVLSVPLSLGTFTLWHINPPQRGADQDRPTQSLRDEHSYAIRVPGSDRSSR